MIFRQLFKKQVNFNLLEKPIHLMKSPLKSSERKHPCEINWKIREIFSESALASFYEEIDNQYFVIDKI